MRLRIHRIHFVLWTSHKEQTKLFTRKWKIVIIKWFTKPVKSYIKADVDDIALRHFITEVLANYYGHVLFFFLFLFSFSQMEDWQLRRINNNNKQKRLFFSEFSFQYLHILQLNPNQSLFVCFELRSKFKLPVKTHYHKICKPIKHPIPKFECCLNQIELKCLKTFDYLLIDENCNNRIKSGLFRLSNFKTYATARLIIISFTHLLPPRH